MPRPRKRRTVDHIPIFNCFKPVGRRLGQTGEVRLFWEELEALRLKDLEGLEQLAAAERMDVSRPTFQRILRSARSKVAQALIEGLIIRVEGGDFQVAPRYLHCHVCGHNWQEPHGSGRGKDNFPCPACGSTEVNIQSRQETRRHSR